MLTDFMLVSGWAFWVLLALVIVFDTVVLSIDDNGTGPTNAAVVISIALVVGAYLFTDLPRYVSSSLLIFYVAVYAILGVLWSIKKWYTFVIEKRDKMKEEFKSRTKIMQTWEDYSKNGRPTALRYKQLIVCWMVLWPWSFSWWVLTWPRRAFVWIYDRLSTLYDRMVDRIWAAS